MGYSIAFRARALLWLLLEILCTHTYATELIDCRNTQRNSFFLLSLFYCFDVLLIETKKTTDAHARRRSC